MKTIDPETPTLALVVEDEPIIADYLASLLRDAGIEAAVATTAADALHLTNTTLFDVMFIDLGLPDQSGLEVIDSVQRAFPELPIVISTGFGASVLRDSIIGQRHVQLLTKPYAAEKLNAVLMKCRFSDQTLLQHKQA